MLDMAVTVLGELLVDGETLSPRERAVLAALVVHAGRPVSPDRLADAYWQDEPPPTWPKQLQTVIVRLRRRLGPGAITTGPGGYTLTADPETIDACRFEKLAATGRLHLTAGEPDRAAVLLADALGLWRGEPYADLTSWPDATAEAGRLDELRALAQEDLLQARLDRGENGSVVGDAEKLVHEHPLRERRWVLLATALYRTGRQADALAALRAARRHFEEELGVDPGPEFGDLEVAVLRHDPGLAVTPADAPREQCPYRGLTAYDAHDADDFFGRAAEVAAALERLDRSRFLALAGPSGCGKSSLVRAGVVPSLRRRGLAVTVTTPGAGALVALTTHGRRARDVLVIDQFEEVFHLGLPDAEVADLCARIADHPGTVVLTVRSDFLDECAAQPALAPLLAEGVRLVTPMTQDQLREAITEPARRAGLRLEPGLVELILRDAAGAPGVLPHVSHALVETWLRREGPVLTVAGYEASGGISGAIAQSAERLHQSLDPRQRELCRSTLLRLVALSPDGSPVRQRLRLRPLREDSDRDRLLARLAGARLISTQGDSVVVAHEAVALAWPRLRGWLEESADDVRRMNALAAAAERWQADGEPAEDLYRGARLEAALELRNAGTVELTPVELRFLDEAARQEESRVAELAARARRDAQQNRRLRGYLGAAVVLLVLAIVATGLLVRSSEESARREAEAEAARESATVEALAARSMALRGTERDVAALLAAEAYRRWPDDPRARSALMGTVTAAGSFVGSTYLEDVPAPLVGVRVPGSELHLLARRDGTALVVDGEGATVAAADPAYPAGAADPPEGPRHEMVAVGVSADGRTGVVVRPVEPPEGGRDMVGSQVVALQLPSGRQRGEVIEVGFQVGSVAVAPDGSWVALGAHQEPLLTVVDLATGRVREHRLVPDGEVDLTSASSLVATTDAGLLAVAGAYADLRLLDPETFRTVRRIPVPPASATIALATDGGLAVASGARHLVAVDLDRGRVRWTHTFDIDHPAPCPWLTVSVAADAAFCGDWFGGLAQHDLRSGAQVRALDPQLGSAGPLSVSADGTELTALGAGAPAVSRWRLDGSGAAHRLVARGHVAYEGYDLEEGRTFLAALRPDTAREFDDMSIFRVWDPDRDEAVVRLPGDAFGTGWVGAGVLVGWSADVQGVAFFDVNDAARGWYRSDPSLDYHHMSWPSPDGTVMLSAAQDGTVWLVDPATGSRTGDVFTATGRVDWASMSYDGRLIATVAWDDGRHVEVHDVATGEVVAEGLEGPQRVAFAPDGELYAATEGRITRHDPADLSRLGTLPGAHGEISSLQFSSDGSLLLATAYDETTSLYDLATGTRLGDPVPTAAPQIVPAFLRPDGQSMAVTVEEGVAVWDLDPDHQFEAACRIAGRELTAEEWATYFGDAEQVATCDEVLARRPGPATVS